MIQMDKVSHIRTVLITSTGDDPTIQILVIGNFHHIYSQLIPHYSTRLFTFRYLLFHIKHT